VIVTEQPTVGSGRLGVVLMAGGMALLAFGLFVE
jgi:hypothetical protein